MGGCQNLSWEIPHFFFFNFDGSPNLKLIDDFPSNSSSLPLVVRLGRYYYDNTPLLGKIVDFNMWDSLLTEQQMRETQRE